MINSNVLKRLNLQNRLVIFCSNHDRIRAFSSTERVNSTSFILPNTNKLSVEEPSSANDGQGIITVYSSISSTNTSGVCNKSELIDYTRGWAWQQIMLSGRLRQRRQRHEQHKLRKQNAYMYDEDVKEQTYDDKDYDSDVLLLLEHDHVYTLGRGANEEYLTFLQGKVMTNNHNMKNDDTTNSLHLSSDKDTLVRHKLSRSSRGIGTARLSVDNRLSNIIDKKMTSSLFANNKSDSNNKWPQSDIYNDIANTLLNESGCSPVIEPSNQVPIYRIERGGEVTYHGPGQLVCYPLLDLASSDCSGRSNTNKYKKDLHWYLRQIEEVIIQTLKEYNIDGYRDISDDNTGVWVKNIQTGEEEKIAAIGISASKWITTHGFAINVNPNLKFFDTSIIIPCGIKDKSNVTSIHRVLKQQNYQQLSSELPSIQDVAKVLCTKFQDVFKTSIEGEWKNI